MAKSKNSKIGKVGNQGDKIISASLSTGGDKNISVRQIENGWLIRETGTVGRGRNKTYTEKEFFSTKNPIQVKSLPVKFGNNKK